LTKLLSASAKLADSQPYIDMKELNASQESLLYVVRTIHVVNYRMREMTPAENFDHLQQDTDFSRFELGQNQRDASASAAKSESNTSGQTDRVNPSPEVNRGGDVEARENLEESTSNQLAEPGSIIYLKKREQKGP
jgi:hypothetical protein